VTLKCEVVVVSMEAMEAVSVVVGVCSDMNKEKERHRFVGAFRFELLSMEAVFCATRAIAVNALHENDCRVMMRRRCLMSVAMIML
jgi:hypothetical protein